MNTLDPPQTQSNIAVLPKNQLEAFSINSQGSAGHVVLRWVSRDSTVTSIVTFYYRAVSPTTSVASLAPSPQFEPFVNVRSLSGDPGHRRGACLLKSSSLVGAGD